MIKLRIIIIMLPFPQRPDKLWLCATHLHKTCDKQHFIFIQGVKIKYLTEKEIVEESSDSDTSDSTSED